MKRIIIFRFDRHIHICRDHLELIKRLNPDTPIHAIYGGEKRYVPQHKKALGKYFETFYVIKNKSKEWKWKNFDLALRDWYIKAGNKIDFDTAYVIEWDLILFDSIENMYSEVKKNELGLTGLTKLNEIEHKWYWTSKEPYKSEWKKLLSFVQEKFEYTAMPFGSLGPGYCFPKKFLEKYSKVEVPDLVHDELRVPLYAQILGFTIKNTGFVGGIYDKKEYTYFNCIGDKEWFITDKTICTELRKKDGRRAFHPFREKIPKCSMID